MAKQSFQNERLGRNTFGLSSTGFNLNKDALIDNSKLASSSKYGKTEIQRAHPGWNVFSILARQIGGPPPTSPSNHQQHHSIQPIARPTNGSKPRKATLREADTRPTMHTSTARAGIPIPSWRETTIALSTGIDWMPIIPSIAMCMCLSWPSSARSNLTIASIDQAILYT
jgi:hypothetical protein